MIAISPPSSPLPANTARISTLAQWSTFFHPTNGIFRGSSSQAGGIEHLDIDLRYIDSEASHAPTNKAQTAKREVHMPDVCVLTLRGGEFCQEVDERMECLKEVLDAICPREVRWLNAFDHPDEQLTITTVMVHPAIIAAGEGWARNGRLAKLVIQGGFPTPNLTAPTPFAVTPAGTPLHSPGLRSAGGLHSIPALARTKPKAIDAVKVAARAERKRLADYALKPRWEFAFGTWAVEEIKWKFDGRYTPAGITSIIKQLLTCLNESYPSPAYRCDLDLPSLLTFSPVSPKIIDDLRHLESSLDLQSDFVAYLADVAYCSLDHGRYFSLWGKACGDEDRYRQSRAFKTQALLLRDPRIEIVHVEEVLPSSPAALPGLAVPELAKEAPEMSPAESHNSLEMPGETDLSTDEDENEALTPPMGQSMIVEQTQPAQALNAKLENLAQSMEGRLVL